MYILWKIIWMTVFIAVLFKVFDIIFDEVSSIVEEEWHNWDESYQIESDFND